MFFNGEKERVWSGQLRVLSGGWRDHEIQGGKSEYSLLTMNKRVSALRVGLLPRLMQYINVHIYLVLSRKSIII